MRRAISVFAIVVVIVAVPFVAAAQASVRHPSNPHADTSTYYVPDFYFYPKYTGDTAFIFRCYDKLDSLMTDIDDYDKVAYYSLFKEYTDSSHTYKDKNGNRQFLPVSFIVKRYDRLGKNKWMRVEYPGNKYSELVENRNENMGSEVILIDRTGTGVADYVKIYNFFKCSLIKR